ncbi:MAG: site-specific integrase [Christensenellales bacterium]
MNNTTMRKMQVLRIVCLCFSLEGYNMSKSSKTERNIHNTQKLQRLLKTLPRFCVTYFRAIEPRTSPLTRINYAYDLRLFFKFIEDELGRNTNNMSPGDLQTLTMNDFERYIEYLRLYYNDESVRENGKKGLARKIASLRSFYKYYYNKEEISDNITTRLATPKTADKPILRLTRNEALKLLHVVGSGDGLSNKQLSYHGVNRPRYRYIYSFFNYGHTYKRIMLA